MKSCILPVSTFCLFAIILGAGCSQNKAPEPAAEAPAPAPPVAVVTAKPAPKPVAAKPEPTVDWKKFVVNAPVSAEEKKRAPRPAPNPLPVRQASNTSESPQWEASQQQSSQPETSTSSGQTTRDFILSTADTIENSNSVSELAGIWLDLDHLNDRNPSMALSSLKSAAQVKQDMLLQPEYAKQYRRGLNLHLSMARKFA